MHLLDARFKATGHENVAMPLFIPGKPGLQKEKDHVEGFAPEVGLGDDGAVPEPPERTASACPTSETLRSATISPTRGILSGPAHEIQPVVQRGALWKNHAPPSCARGNSGGRRAIPFTKPRRRAIEETEQQLETYADFCENELNIPVLKGKKTDKEKFAGAGSHLYHRGHDARRQGAAGAAPAITSGDGFSRAFGVQFHGRDNTL